jgi:hypothetical protein
MELTTAQRSACRSLNDTLSAGELGSSDSNEQDWYGCLGDGVSEEVEDDDDECEDDEISLADESVDESTPTARQQIAENPIQTAILELIISLYTQLPIGGDDKFFSPIIRFAVLASLQRTGQWLPPRRITHLLAVLLFCGREVIMALMHRRLLDDPTIRYSKCVPHAEVTHVPLIPRTRAFEEIACFVDDAREGPIPSMYLLMRPLNRFATAEEGALRFTALDFSGNNIIVEGQVLYLSDIRHFVETLIVEIQEDISTKLFFGIDVFNMGWSPGIVYEEPRNISVGYSCFCEARNNFVKHKDDLLRAILTHPRVCGHFHYIDQQGRVVWKAAPCFAYMKSCHEVEMKLFCGTHTSVGEPARATEFGMHLIENVSGGTLRNVLVMFQYFCMMGTFNKISHTTERDVNMMRVPHPEIGRLWMLYLTFVRPVIVVWQKYFSDRKAVSRAKSRLFFGPHRAVSPAELSRSLTYHTHRLLGIKISVRLWRHIATWFLNHNPGSFSDYLEFSNRSALALQMGHSDKIHSLYASDLRLPAKIDLHIFFQTMRTSGLWHELVGWKSNLLGEMNRRNSKDRMGVEWTWRNEVNMGYPAEKTPNLPSDFVSSLAQEVKNVLMPEIVRAVVQTRANDLASLLDAVGLNVQTPVSRPLLESGPVTHISHPSRLLDLRSFLGNNNAAFKHTQQALATELIASKNPSILLIGPTGVSLTHFHFI